MYFYAYSLSDFRLTPLVNYLIYSLFIFEYTYKKSGCLLKCCSAFNTNALHLYKKSGTALLLFRYSRLSHCLCIRTSNTEAHADMYARAHTYL